jgi:BolA protein
MAMADTIAAKLKDAFDPAEIDVRDVSYQHAGHAGSREGGETHFEVRMKAAAFASASRVEAHRMVNKVLANELASTVHALQLELSA